MQRREIKEKRVEKKQTGPAEREKDRDERNKGQKPLRGNIREHSATSKTHYTTIEHH